MNVQALLRAQASKMKTFAISTREPHALSGKYLCTGLAHRCSKRVSVSMLPVDMPPASIPGTARLEILPARLFSLIEHDHLCASSSRTTRSG